MSITHGPVPNLESYPECPANRQYQFGYRILVLLVCLWALTPRDAFTQMHSEYAEAAGSPVVLELDRAVATALENSPALAGLQAQADAMRTLPSQVNALPDPILSLNAMNMPTDSFDLDQEPMTQLQLAVSQSFPFPGKRKLKRQVFEHRVEASHSILAERRTAIVGQVRATWWQLMSLDRSLQIVEQNKVLMRDFVDIAQTKYKVGSGLQQDVLLAQLELSRLLDRELRLKGMRHGAQAELNALMGRPANWTISLPAVPPNTDLPALPAESDLLREAGDLRPLIDVQRNLVEAARTNLDLAEKDRFPDLKLGVGYGFRQGFDPLRLTDRSDLLTVMLSINVPLYSGSKQSKAIEQRSHEVSRQLFKMHDTLRNVEAAVSSNIADYDSARSHVALLETAIIPQAQQTVSSMLAGYQVNEVDFLNVINTQITLYNAQINYWESLGNAKQALARLASAIGKEALYE
jgi:cobalt-zinc-cadmium efflux system outer membrane protein